MHISLGERGLQTMPVLFAMHISSGSHGPSPLVSFGFHVVFLLVGFRCLLDPFWFAVDANLISFLFSFWFPFGRFLMFC